jgi:hypothetical protein
MGELESNGRRDFPMLLGNQDMEPAPESSETLSSPAEPYLPSIHDRAKQAVREWLAVLEKDTPFQKALRSLTAHQTDPSLKQILGTLLPVFACLAIPRRSGRSRESIQGVWALGTGKTWRGIKNFPARLRGIADEVQKINDTGFFSPNTWITKDTTRARITKGHFLRLPGLLRIYGAYLEALASEKIPAAWQSQIHPTPRRHSPTLFWLSDIVKVATGRFRDREVCDLLDATAAALGVKYQFDPILLAQARSRYNRQKKPARAT